MGELADHLKLQNERNAKRAELASRIESLNGYIAGHSFTIQQLEGLIRVHQDLIKAYEAQMRDTLAILKDSYMDEAPLQNRPQPETHRGVSID